MFDDDSYDSGKRSLFEEIEIYMGNSVSTGSSFHVSSFAPRREQIVQLIVQRNDELIRRNASDVPDLVKLQLTDDPRYVEEKFVDNYLVVIARKYYNMCKYGIKLIAYAANCYLAHPYLSKFHIYFDQFVGNMTHDIVCVIVEYFRPERASFDCERLFVRKPNLMRKAGISSVVNFADILSETLSAKAKLCANCVKLLVTSSIETDISSDAIGMSAPGSTQYMLEGDVPYLEHGLWTTTITAIRGFSEECVATEEKTRNSKASARAKNRPRSKKSADFQDEPDTSMPYMGPPRQNENVPAGNFQNAPGNVPVGDFQNAPGNVPGGNFQGVSDGNPYFGQNSGAPNETSYFGQNSGAPNETSYFGQNSGAPGGNFQGVSDGNSYFGQNSSAPDGNSYFGQNSSAPDGNSYFGQNSGAPNETSYFGQNSGHPNAVPRSQTPSINTFHRPENRDPHLEDRAPANNSRQTPNANRQMPNISRQTPNANRQMPNISRQTPNANRQATVPAPQHGNGDYFQLSNTGNYSASGGNGDYFQPGPNVGNVDYFQPANANQRQTTVPQHNNVDYFQSLGGNGHAPANTGQNYFQSSSVDNYPASNVNDYFQQSPANNDVHLSSNVQIPQNCSDVTGNRHSELSDHEQDAGARTSIGSLRSRSRRRAMAARASATPVNVQKQPDIPPPLSNYSCGPGSFHPVYVPPLVDARSYF